MSRSLALLVVATAFACSSPSAGDGGAGGGAGGGSEPFTGFDCRTSGDPMVCTEPGASVQAVGSCGTDGVCLCQPGWVRSPLTAKCWPSTGFCPGPDGGWFTATGVPVASAGHCDAVPCAIGGSCAFDAGASCTPPPGGCVQSASCGLIECRAGCHCASAADARCSCDGPDACQLGADFTCNDDPQMSALAGTCVQAGNSPTRCLCNAGFERSPATGKCRALDSGP